MPLRHRYGGSVCFSAKSPTHFASGDEACAPLASHPPYFFVFAEHGLSPNGSVRWNFEALLHDRFGGRLNCWADLSAFPEFIGIRPCPAQSHRGRYDYLFVGARHSMFHLTSTDRPQGRFGNYPVPVRVGNRFVACDQQHRAYLVELPEAFFPSLECVKPL